MSTFGALQTAFSGLQAARAGIDLTGQNIANSTTVGYTRQRITQSAVGGATAASVFSAGLNIGSGVAVTGIARLGDTILDTRVRAAASSMGYWDVAASAVSTIETGLNEPGKNGLSSTLSDFWSSWQNLSNNPGTTGQGATVIAQAGQLSARLAAGYTTAAAGWTDERTAAGSTVAAVNDATAQVARLNDLIRRTVAAGGSPNELLDQRDTLLTDVTRLTGATVRTNNDSTVDLVLGGNTLVSGTTSRTLALTGALRVEDAAGSPVRVVWADGSGGTADIDGGELAGRLSTLAPADSTGTGGPWAESAAVYNKLATSVASTVNALHRTGAIADGTTNHDFFALSAGVPAALGLTVVPTGVGGIAAARPGMGGRDGGVADAIAHLSSSPTGPDAAWSAYVVQVGVLSRTTTQQAALSDSSLTSATAAQTSQAAVDLDEETTNLLTYQHAYQGAARVMTAIDEMLDVLINRTGIVGR